MFENISPLDNIKVYEGSELLKERLVAEMEEELENIGVRFYPSYNSFHRGRIMAVSMWGKSFRKYFKSAVG